MTYDINTISQSDLLKLLLSVKDQFSIDAIDGEKAKYELEQQEKALLRRKQLESEIAKSGFSRNEILDYISVKNGKELFSTAVESDKAPRQIFGNFLYEGELSILFGDAGVGKSILAYDIAFFVSGGGHKWEGLESPNISTLYLDLGMSTKQFVSRYKTAEPYIPDTFHRAMIDSTKLSEKEILPEVTRLIVGTQSTDYPPKFIIVDNITNGFGTMTAATKMRDLLSELKNLKEKFGLTMLLIANSKKQKLRIIKLNDLGGWTNHINFIDSIFAISSSQVGNEFKYIKQIKSRADEKTDEADAEWLMLLHSYGMVKPCFQPDNVARQIRNLTRHRSTLITTAGREVQHMQKAMEQMNIKLSTVITDILGKSGMAIIRAIIDGNHNPNSLAQLADGRCRASKDTIAKSLDGTWDDDLLFVLKQSVELYDYYQKKVAECEREIERLMIRYSAQVDVEGAGKLSRSEKHTTYKNAPDIDVEKYGHALWGVNLMAMPGMGAGAILQLIGELGYDFVSKFDTCEKFCKWCLTDFSWEGKTVMMAPGAGFYATPGSGRNQVRLAYVLEKKELAEALVVLGKALQAYNAR